MNSRVITEVALALTFGSLAIVVAQPQTLVFVVAAVAVAIWLCARASF